MPPHRTSEAADATQAPAEPGARTPDAQAPAAEGDQRAPSVSSRGAARGRRRWLDVLAVAALLTAIAYLHVRVVRVAFITSGSMMPTISPGDRVVLDLSAYRDEPPERGDIVALASKAEGDFEVKRVVGVGGDEISIVWGVVFRNGEPINEPYIRQAMFLEDPVRVKLEDDELFVMGDNRNASQDSRDCGPVHESEVVGRVHSRILPFSRAGRLH